MLNIIKKNKKQDTKLIVENDDLRFKVELLEERNDSLEKNIKDLAAENNYLKKKLNEARSKDLVDEVKSLRTEMKLLEDTNENLEKCVDNLEFKLKKYLSEDIEHIIELAKKLRDLSQPETDDFIELVKQLNKPRVGDTDVKK